MSFFSPTIFQARGTHILPTPNYPNEFPHVPDDYRIPPSQLPLSLVGAINVLDPRYGAKGDMVTSDTGAVQSALDAAHNKAASNQIVDVILPPGFGFLLGQLTPRPQTRLWAYGATITPNLTEMGSGPLFSSVGAEAINRFEIRGGAWNGTGNETINNMLFNVAPGGSANLEFHDMYVTNWGTCVYYLRNTQTARVINNKCLNCNNGTGPSFAGGYYNTINIVGDNNSAAPPNDVMVLFNRVTGAFGGSISLSMVTTGNFQLAILVGWNKVIGPVHTGFAGGITGEASVAGNNYYGVKLIGNDVEWNGTGGAPEGALNFNNGEYHQSHMVGNRLISTGDCMILNGPDWTLTDNWCQPGAGRLGLVANTAFWPLYSMSGNTLNGGPGGGSGARSGTFTLVAGNATVNTTEVHANDAIIIWPITKGGSGGQLTITIVDKTSFSAVSSSGTDTSKWGWKIAH